MIKKEQIQGRLIYLIGKTQGLLYRNFVFYIVALGSGVATKVARLPVSWSFGVFGNCRLTTRLLRLEPRCAGRLDENRYLISILGKLWILDVQNKSIRSLIEMRAGYSILNFCERDGYVYWGDYGSNPNHDEINIYRLGTDLSISVAYSFPKNSVRHIHNIIKTNDGFLVMTGDNERDAGIYKANADWTEVKQWKNGEQKYRAVVGFPYMGGLLYATDSVETENHLRLIDVDGKERELCVMNGSCIYGGETKDYYFFSTTVESHEGGGICKLLSNQLGGGIKNKEVHIIAVNKQDLNVLIIGKYRKDVLPMKLFQYGTTVFPQGQEGQENGVWCYNMACEKIDGKSMYLTI